MARDEKNKVKRSGQNQLRMMNDENTLDNIQFE